MKVGKVLERYRRLNRVKMKQISERLNMSAPSYRRIEKDQRDIKISELVDIAKMYGIAPHVMIFQMMTVDDIPKDKIKTFEMMQPTIAAIAEAFNNY